MRKILMVLFLVIVGYGDNNFMDSSELKDLKYVNSVMKVYSQTIKWEHPKWPAVYKKQSNGTFIIEFIPKEQKLKTWKDMLTIQGLKGLSKRKDITLKHMEASLVNQMKKISSSELIFKKLHSGNKAVIFLLGLKKIPEDLTLDFPKGIAEIGLYLVVKGNEDFYVVHRSWRGKEIINNNFPFSKEELMEWFNIFKEIEIY